MKVPVKVPEGLWSAFPHSHGSQQIWFFMCQSSDFEHAAAQERCKPGEHGNWPACFGGRRDSGKSPPDDGSRGIDLSKVLHRGGRDPNIADDHNLLGLWQLPAGIRALVFRALCPILGRPCQGSRLVAP